MNPIEIKAWLDKHAPNYEIPTRIVAERVMGWQYYTFGGFKGFTKPDGCKTSLGRFNPFSSLDDAKLVVDKLHFKDKESFGLNLIHVLNIAYDSFEGISDNDYWKLANASALEKMTALFLAIPELMEGVE